MAEAWRAPIYWLDAAGNPATDRRRLCAPFIDIEIRSATSKWIPCRALVDTGSHGTLVSRALIERISAPRTVVAPLTGNWTQHEVQFYAIELRYTAFQRMIMPVQCGELGDADPHHFTALVGIDTLRHGTLVLEPAPEPGFLEFRRDHLITELKKASRQGPGAADQ